MTSKPSRAGPAARRPSSAVPAAVTHVARSVRAMRRVPTWRWAVLIACLLAVIWLLVAATGGTRTALPHLFYLPILFAVGACGARGGVATAAVATLLAGPLMPGDPQMLLFWLIRGVMFTLVALAMAAALTAQEAALRDQVREDLTRALDLEPRTPHPTDVDLTDAVPAVLQRRDYDIVFQPIYSLHDGKVNALEALTRFRPEPYRSPDLWFAAAESIGLGTQLQLSVLESALKAAETAPRDVAVAVNVSATTLADPDLPRALAGQRRQVILELTEHDVIGNYAFLQERLKPLRDSGVRIAVDDAGAGAASFRHIVQLEPDMIKLDASLTQGVRTSQVLQTLGRAFVAFARDTGSLLVVEGIENRQDLLTWTELGADCAQGFLLARPAPIGSLGLARTGVPKQRPR